MNYQEAQAALQANRNHTKKKLQNNTYLERQDLRDDCIHVRLHDTNIITFHSDGRIGLCNGGFPTVTTHDRMNTYLPRPYRVSGEPVETRRSGPGATVLSRHGEEVLVDNVATISSDGSLDGGDVTEYREQRRQERNANNRVRNRARFWVRKARGLFVDRTACTARRWECSTRGRWNRRNLREGEYKCGCKVIFKQPTIKQTVQEILAEENVTVRAAMMQCYGIEKFFLDANPKILDERDGYQLVALPFNRWDDMKALKMTCPSTGAVYVNSVPPNTSDVNAGLNWMFQMPEGVNYLDTVAQAT